MFVGLFVTPIRIGHPGTPSLKMVAVLAGVVYQSVL